MFVQKREESCESGAGKRCLGNPGDVFAEHLRLLRVLLCFLASTFVLSLLDLQLGALSDANESQRVTLFVCVAQKAKCSV